MIARAEAARGLGSPAGITWFSVWLNAGLSAAKIGVGALCASQAILADGVHSVSDLATDIAVLAGLRASGRPADRDHPHGHRRITTLVTLFIGAALLATAAWIVFRAIVTLAEPHGFVSPVLPFWAAVASIVVKEWLYQITVRVGRRCGDASVVANAWHHRSDSWSSIAAAAGLAGVALGGPSWAFLDHVTAIVLSVFLIAVGVRIVRTSAGELVDSAPDSATQSRIEAIVAGTPGVEAYHAVRARRMGGKVELDVHILVDPEQTVRAGHDIATEVRRRMLESEHDVIEVVVHVEPLGEDDDGYEAR